MLELTPKMLVKALFLGFGIRNNKTKNVYWIHNSHLMKYDYQTNNITQVSSTEEEINNTDWAIDMPKNQGE